jgi:hypothetical protein
MPTHTSRNSKTGSAAINPRNHPKAKATSVPASRRSSEAELQARAATTQAPTSVQPVEPEDAYLTGVSRSLQRRLLGLNVSQAKAVSEASTPGIHSTGSYTDGMGVKPEKSLPAKSPKPVKNGKKK